MRDNFRATIQKQSADFLASWLRYNFENKWLSKNKSELDFVLPRLDIMVEEQLAMLVFEELHGELELKFRNALADAISEWNAVNNSSETLLSMITLAGLIQLRGMGVLLSNFMLTERLKSLEESNRFNILKTWFSTIKYFPSDENYNLLLNILTSSKLIKTEVVELFVRLCELRSERFTEIFSALAKIIESTQGYNHFAVMTRVIQIIGVEGLLRAFDHLSNKEQEMLTDWFIHIHSDSPPPLAASARPLQIVIDYKNGTDRYLTKHPMLVRSLNYFQIQENKLPSTIQAHIKNIYRDDDKHLPSTFQNLQKEIMSYRESRENE